MASPRRSYGRRTPEPAEATCGSPGPANGSLAAPPAESTSSVKSYVRVRPFAERERESGQCRSLVRMTDKVTTVFDASNRWEPKASYTFDGCFWSIPPGESQVVLSGEATQFAGQEDVYRVCGAPMVQNVLDGYNACLFAYGQTGSGKTYSMMGVPGSAEQEGVIPRACRELLSKLDRKLYTVMASYIEFYNTELRDLLSRRSGELRLREDRVAGIFIENLSQHQVTDVATAMHLIEVGDRERSTATTKMNERSSRSHAIFTLTVAVCGHPGLPGDEGKRVLQGALQKEGLRGKLHLVDLAGSERIKSSGAEGGRREEATRINLSLTTLGRVIDALAEVAQGVASRERGHIPYRDTNLTWFLKDSLGGNSRTAMLATISPSVLYQEETWQSLRYASHARKIVNVAVLNTGNPEMTRIKMLEAQVELLQKRQMQAKKTDGMLDRVLELESKCALAEERYGELQRVYSQQIQDKSARQSAQRDVRIGLDNKLQRAEREIEKHRERATALQKEMDMQSREREVERVKVQEALSGKKTADKRAREAESAAAKARDAESRTAAGLKESEAKRASLEENVERMIKTINDLVEQAEESDVILEQLRTAKERAEAGMDESRERVTELEAELGDCRRELSDARAAPPGAAEEVVRQQEENKRLLAEIERLQGQAAKLRAARQKAEDQRIAAEGQAEKEVSALRRDLQRTVASRDEVQQELRKQRSAVAELQLQLDSAAEQLRSAEEAREAAAEEQRAAEASAKEGEAALAQARAQYDAARATIADMESQQSAELSQAQSELQKTADECESLGVELTSAKEELQVRSKLLEKQDDRVASLTGELKAQGARAEEVEEELQELRARQEEADSRVSEARSREADMRREMDDLRGRLARLEDEMAAATGRNQSLVATAELEAVRHRDTAEEHSRRCDQLSRSLQEAEQERQAAAAESASAAAALREELSAAAAASEAMRERAAAEAAQQAERLAATEEAASADRAALKSELESEREALEQRLEAAAEAASADHAAVKSELESERTALERRLAASEEAASTDRAVLMSELESERAALAERLAAVQEEAAAERAELSAELQHATAQHEAARAASEQASSAAATALAEADAHRQSAEAAEAAATRADEARALAEGARAAAEVARTEAEHTTAAEAQTRAAAEWQGAAAELEASEARARAGVEFDCASLSADFCLTSAGAAARSSALDRAARLRAHGDMLGALQVVEAETRRSLESAVVVWSRVQWEVWVQGKRRGAERLRKTQLVLCHGEPGADVTLYCNSCEKAHLEEHATFYYCSVRKVNYCADCVQARTPGSPMLLL
eukprot:TRINITY_DN5567_c0_g1_i1.p1 TRINITY_DN5567_c0_g1~~TRINITY_DN5567_c0_g1_i1.p1  ORF type:complete len:1323 (+),score=515.78 TRINITY_DN5567_c0_g1_i1:70-4038(+)